MKMFKWHQTSKHVLSIYLKQNDSTEQATFLNFGGTFSYLSNFRATFGYIVKQLFLNLLAQSIHAYSPYLYSLKGGTHMTVMVVFRFTCKHG